MDRNILETKLSFKLDFHFSKGDYLCATPSLRRHSTGGIKLNSKLKAWREGAQTPTHH